MDEREWLAARFESDREHLRGVAYRMLGSVSDADDAVQEAWLRLSRAETRDIDNLTGWLTTVVGRVCLDMLRARKAKGEQPLADHSEAVVAGRGAAPRPASDPEREALLAESVGLALLVVLEELSPDERLAFVLHDLFDLPFERIARLLERTLGATRQLASRARRKVRGTTSIPEGELTRRREIVDAFLAASREGEFEALLAVLDPDVVIRMDAELVPAGAPSELRGAEAVAKRAVAGGARAAQVALVDGGVGVVVAPLGRLLMVLEFAIADGRIVAIEAVANRDRLRGMQFGVLEV